MRTRKEGFHEFHETRERVPWSDETRLVKNFPKERSPYGRIHIVYIIISAQFFNGRQQTRSSPTDSSAHVTASRDILQPCAPRVRTVSGSMCVLSVCSPPCSLHGHRRIRGISFIGLKFDAREVRSRWFRLSTHRIREDSEGCGDGDESK